MQKISFKAFTFSKATQILSAEISDLQGQLDLGPLLNYEAFEIQGAHETRRYCLWTVKREGARHEVGDIQNWEFRHVDNYGRGLDGPKVIIWND